MTMNTQAIIEKLKSNKEFTLDLIVRSNPEAVYDNLINNDIEVGATLNEIKIALRQLIAAGEQNLVNAIINVPANYANLSQPEIDALNYLKNKN